MAGKKKHVFVEIVSGPEGPCICLSNSVGGYRIAGPKPWGGGKIVRMFKVQLDDLIREAKRHAFVE